MPTSLTQSSISIQLLTYKEEDGQLIEPEFFCPVIPLILINGCRGIGTGWSTFIPQHNPLDVLKYIRAMVAGERNLPTINPWVRDFKGNITVDHQHGSYITEGIITKTSDATLRITELPIGVWTNRYKENLVSMMKKNQIKSFTEDHTTTNVSFDVEVNMAELERLRNGDLHRSFKLRNRLSTRK